MRFILLFIFISYFTAAVFSKDDNIKILKSNKNEFVVLKADKNNASTKIEPPVNINLNSGKQASFIVTYNNFSSQAQTAFQYAVDIWASILSSPVPVRVKANWVSLDPNVLGSASAATFLRGFQNAPKNDTWYSIALAEKFIGSSYYSSPDSADLVANFNSNFANWYFGTDGNCPAGKYDFVTVVLHELCHGLGFQGSMDADGGQGSWGFGSGFPFVFDHFTQDGSGQSLLDITIFPNPSATLATALTNDNVYFNGTNSSSSNNFLPVKLYAPAIWEASSSYSHLNEISFPAGTPNSLMTPSLSAAEAIHHPGNITLAIFEDIGWTTNLVANKVMVYPGDADNNGEVNALDILPIGVHFLKQGGQRQNTSFTWEEKETVVWSDSIATYADANGDGIVDEKDVIGVAVNWGNSHTASINKPSVNYYDKELLKPFKKNFELIYNSLNGDGPEVTKIKNLLINLFDFENQIAGSFQLDQNYPNPFNPTTRISFTLPKAQSVNLVVLNSRGQIVKEIIKGKSFEQGIHSVDLDASDLSNGVYIYTLRTQEFQKTRKMIVLK